jgi:signal transduction histidine kinase/HAMP domain-containing protein/FixJ family two-component response regulator
LSRSAERIIAAAPALLGATSRERRNEINAELAVEVQRLNSKLIELKSDGSDALPVLKIEPNVSALMVNLAGLEELVTRRLQTSEHIAALRRGVFATNEETQRLFAPWLEVMDRQIAQLSETVRRSELNPPIEAAARLAALIQLQSLTQGAQRKLASGVDLLVEASTTEQPRRLPILAFQLGLALRDIEVTAEGLDQRLQPLFLEQAAKLRQFTEAPNAITEVRGQELALVGEGERRLAETARASAELTRAVDQLGGAAMGDIGNAIRDAMAVQRVSARTLVAVGILSVLTSILIVWLYVGRNIVRRLTALSEGTLAIAGGDLRAPLPAQGSDEIGAMGRAVEIFRRNTVERDELLLEKAQAADRLEEEVKQRTRELTEALERQKATSEVLNVISRSPGQLQPVFDTILRLATRICGAKTGILYTYKDGEFAASATLGVAPAYTQWHDAPIRPGPLTGLGRVIETRQTIHIVDARAERAYLEGDPLRVATADLLGARSLLNVPMLKDDELIGAIGVYRMEVRPFSDQEIRLITSFADQAVIALENARLFDEVQARTRELSEALEQQTATADVLKVISRSPFDLQTVLDTLVQSAVQVCEADAGAMARERDGSHFQVAHHGTPAGYDDFIKNLPLSPGRGSVVGRVLLEGKSVQIADVLADPDYAMHGMQEITDFRTLLGVPLLREGKPVGVFVLWRRTVQPFSDKQIELLTTFADQAVIAIENVRLFDEIQDKSRQLEIANKYKSHFIASASHDLRQPLHALNLFVAQLRTEASPEERSRLAARIDAAVASMNELFSALLDMTKLDAGILESHITEFPVSRLLARIETTFAGAAREKGLRLRVVPSSAWVCSDVILLERMLLNLVSNAVRYTAHGGIVVGCRHRGSHLRIDVHDSGTGIAADQQRHVFGEFYQVSRQETDRQSGLGLGLAIVDRLARLLDHPVELWSEPGRGSRFSISAALAPQQNSVDESPALPAAIIDPARGKLVAVIDDDPLVLEGMGGILRSWGCNVIVGASEEIIAAKIRNQRRPPDLIISDYRLAKGNTGIAAIKRLREALGTAIPAFLISGDTAPERLRDASASGFQLLHKPVPPMRLRAMLNQLVKTSETPGMTTAFSPRHRSAAARDPEPRLQ